MQIPERYTFIENDPVGHGSMGWVYKAWDSRLNRPVALKLLRVENGSGDARVDVSGALREARTLAQISHPAILQVYDVVEATPDSWIICEWLEGRSLDKLNLPLHPLAVMAIASEALSALAAVHAAGVVHRDIKPSNMLLCSSGRLVLLDFGVAFMPGGSSGVTIAGTPRYSDARRLEGLAPDERSDLFSLGLVLLELLSGEAVLPALAPLPLYRYLTQSLSGRVFQLTNGAFPPLSEILDEMFASVDGKASVKDERDPGMLAARFSERMRQMFHRFVAGSPMSFLREYVVDGVAVKADVEEKFRAETESMLSDASLSPKLRAQWMSFARKQAEIRRLLSGALRPKNRRWIWGALAVGAAVAVIAGLTGALKSWVNRERSVLVVESPQATPLVATGASPTPVATSAPKELPKGNGQIWLTANAWANVYIDGNLVGQLPLATPISLAPGLHKIRLENPRAEPAETTVRVRAGSSIRERFNLVPKKEESR